VPFLGCVLPRSLRFRVEVEHPFLLGGMPVPFDDLPSELVGGRSRADLVRLIQEDGVAGHDLEAPSEGRTTDELLDAVIRALDREAPDDEVIAAIWDGWNEGPALPATAGVVDLGTRRYHLVKMERSSILSVWNRSSVGPSCWWDGSNRWLVAVDVDQSATTIATSDAELAGAVTEELGPLLTGRPEP
jgi:hypothetical protein